MHVEFNCLSTYTFSRKIDFFSLFNLQYPAMYIIRKEAFTFADANEF